MSNNYNDKDLLSLIDFVIDNERLYYSKERDQIIHLLSGGSSLDEVNKKLSDHKKRAFDMILTDWKKGRKL